MGALLAARTDIGQLVILAIVFLGWVVQEVIKAQKRKRMRSPQPQPQGPKPSRRSPGPQRERQRQDVVFGTRPLAHLPGGEGKSPRAPAPTPAPSRRRARSIERTPHEAAVVRAGRAGGRAVTRLEETEDTTRTTVSVASRRRRKTLRRLQVGDIPGTLRDKTRVGILWSEVLGPCRALRGPHRPPTLERRRATQGG